MNDFMNFLINHWLLAVLFIVAFIWLIIEEARHQGAGGVRQTPESAVLLMNHDNAIALDLRDINAFNEGHIANSIHIPAEQIENSVNKITKYKQSPLILVCAIGQQSVKVIHKLKKLGFDNVFILAGGISAWKKANLPLTKK